MRIYSTLSARKDEFKPSGDTVKMYVCGVTPYASAHLGHAMSYITFDVVRRYLEFRGYKVRHVQNFTDIDDKIIERANRMGRPAKELAEGYIAEYFQDMDALNIRHAHVYPRATEEIPKIIEIVEGLISKGFAYSASGDVYFRVLKARGYGKLSHRTLDSMMAGARIEPGAQKEHPMDFALWKASKPGEPQWASPWGQGRPGWHIECSAMSLKYLGESLDIHGGGQDLIFPHHENEIAQSESFTGVEPFARCWMHNGLLQMGEDKMSKSLGNLITVKEALSNYGADGLRVFVLGSHYRMPLKYSEEALSAAKRGAERIRYAAAVESKGGGEALDASKYRDSFIVAMDDDFNAPQALASLFDLAREINRGSDGGQDVRSAQAKLRELGEVLGLTLQERKGVDGLDATPYIELLLETRRALREAKQWALADKIRDRLSELGVVLEDAPKGTVWKRK